MIKNIIYLSLMLMAVMSVENDAYARAGYESTLSNALGNGAAVSCNACHSGTPSSGSAVLPMALTWRSGANLALSDSDGDGFTNAQEAKGFSTDFNANVLSPFTSAKKAEGSSSTKVVVTGAGIVTETAITDIYAQSGITLAAGHSIAGVVSPLINSFPATVTFNKAVNAGDKVYTTDLLGGNTPVTTGVVFNANGSVTVSGLTGPINLVVDRATPVAPAAGSPRGGEEGEGCVSGQLSIPLLMFFSMLMLGFMVKWKRG